MNFCTVWRVPITNIERGVVMAVVVGRLDAARSDSENQIEGAETIFSAPTRCRIRGSFPHWRQCPVLAPLCRQ